MSTNRFEKFLSLGGIAATTLAAFAFALVAAASADESVERRSKIQLLVDRDGVAERLTLVDLHAMAVGETRSLATESGRPVTVTRDAEGFAVDVDGKTIRVMDQFSEDVAGERRFEKRIVIGDPGEGDGVMVLHGRSGEPGDVVVIKERSAHGSAFAFATDGAELPAVPMGVEGTISRLEQNATFQELDAATREKVLSALRESAPARLWIEKTEGGDGRTRVMVRAVDEKVETDDND